MLISLKNKQRQIASLTLSMFIGSWLLVLCQACFAFDESHTMQSAEQRMGDMTETCHESSVDEDTSISDEHCVGACDCHVVTVTLNSEKKSESVSKIKFTPDLHVYYVTQTVFSNRAPPQQAVFSPPERALFLPFHTYNVLLI